MAGTLVKTQEGYQPIEELEVNQKVWSYHVASKKLELQAITNVVTNQADAHVQITTTDGTKIRCTGGHRFWMPRNKTWKAASQLSLGDYLYHASAQQNLYIETIEKQTKPVKTYNLEVNQNHNYLVTKQDILTHNKTFSYSDKTKHLFRFYILKDFSFPKETKYVGITTRQLQIRHDEHVKEGEKALAGEKPYNAWKEETVIDHAVITTKDGKKAIFEAIRGKEMTFFEARVIEQYLMNYHGGGHAHKGLGKLLNRQNAMSQESFEKYKADLDYNPCRFFV